MTSYRDWLAQALRGERVSLTGLDARGLVDESERQGVTALVARALGNGEEGALQWMFYDRMRRGAAVSLFLEAEYRRVLDLLHADGLRPLLLKGSSLGYWLYPEAYLRPTSDFDLLFESARQAKEAASILRQHGYSGGSYFGPHAHEVALHHQMSPAFAVHIDLHWRLFNHPGFAKVLPNEQLFAEAVPVPRYDALARGLCPAHATVHACLHRAMNLHMGVGDFLKWLFDLHLLAAALSVEDWRKVLEICREQGVSGVCLDGFRASGHAFGTSFPEWLLAELERFAGKERLDPSRLGEWCYMQRYAISSVPTTMGRARWILAKMFPSPSYLRSFYGTGLSWRQLMFERMRRLIGRVR